MFMDANNTCIIPSCLFLLYFIIISTWNTHFLMKSYCEDKSSGLAFAAKIHWHFTQKSALSSRILEAHHKQSENILNFLCTLYCAFCPFYYTHKHTNSRNPAHKVSCYKLWESYTADCNQFDSIRKLNAWLSVLPNAH